MKLKVNGLNATHTQRLDSVRLNATKKFKNYLKEIILDDLCICNLMMEVNNGSFKNSNVYNALDMPVGVIEDTADLDVLIDSLTEAVQDAEFDAGEQVFTITTSLNEKAVDIVVNPIWGITEITKINHIDEQLIETKMTQDNKMIIQINQDGEFCVNLEKDIENILKSHLNDSDFKEVTIVFPKNIKFITSSFATRLLKILANYQGVKFYIGGNSSAVNSFKMFVDCNNKYMKQFDIFYVFYTDNSELDFLNTLENKHGLNHYKLLLESYLNAGYSLNVETYAYSHANELNDYFNKYASVYLTHSWHNDVLSSNDATMRNICAMDKARLDIAERTWQEIKLAAQDK